MAKLITVQWRDIPAQVIVKEGRKSVKAQLSDRFQEAIDSAAMRAGKGGSDAYMEDWQRISEGCGEDLQQEAEAAVARLEAAFSDEDLEQLVRNQGVSKS